MKWSPDDDPHIVWDRECEVARDSVLSERHELQAETGIEAARRLLAVAHALAGVACPRCSGFGERAYGDTSTYWGGAGGQAITHGVCDLCWGTGRSDKTGPDRRRAASRVKSAYSEGFHDGATEAGYDVGGNSEAWVEGWRRFAKRGRIRDANPLTAPIDEVEDALRARGWDPEEIAQRGREFVAGLLAERPGFRGQNVNEDQKKKTAGPETRGFGGAEGSRTPDL